MNRTTEYLEEAQSFLDYNEDQGPLVRLSIQRDMALVELQARQLEQLELICNKLHEEA